MAGPWMIMAHGFVNAIYDHQGGPRGDVKYFSESMLMAVAQRPLAGGTLGLRAMASLDPAMGARGYPLLFQTGESADGREPLRDRQHPHDLFMELAGTYSYPLGGEASVFSYFGLPGEPALGPPVFMHRFSGMDNPQAPITHHWLDSTHITYGVATAGLIWRDLKWEASTFRGREPDQHRWDIEQPGFDSYSTRVSWNPAEDWALQASVGRIVSPEALEADVDQIRLTASASMNWRWRGNPAQTTILWGRNRNRPGQTLDGFLLETSMQIGDAHTLFARLERVEKDELFDLGGGPGHLFVVNQLSLGAVHDFVSWRHVRPGIGGVGSIYPIPESLHCAYGKLPVSFMVFLRAKII